MKLHYPLRPSGAPLPKGEARDMCTSLVSFLGRMFTISIDTDKGYVSFIAAGNDHHVIARPNGPWQSPGTIYRPVPRKQTLYQEIATSLSAPRNDTVIGSLHKNSTYLFSLQRLIASILPGKLRLCCNYCGKLIYWLQTISKKEGYLWDFPPFYHPAGNLLKS